MKGVPDTTAMMASPSIEPSRARLANDSLSQVFAIAALFHPPSSTLHVRAAQTRTTGPFEADNSSNMPLGGTNFDPNALLRHDQKIIIQRVTTTVAFISVVSCILSVYWFVLMRRNFRRTLVMLLLLSDLFKSTWFMVFPARSLAVGGIASGSRFCDTGGFFLQAAIESCDVAILMMSIHMSLQVFNHTSSRVGPDGLYRFRHAVYAIWILLPSFMAGLAFVPRGRGSYLSQGAFCTLPIRPFWYRLALSWIPRYLIWLYVTVTAIRIYTHVGSGFRVFANVADSSSNDDSKLGNTDLASRQFRLRKTRKPNVEEPVSNSRRPSTLVHIGDEGLSAQSSPKKTTHKASRDSLTPEAHQSSHLSDPRQNSHATCSSSFTLDPNAAEVGQGNTAAGGPLVNINSTAEYTANSRRRAIQRQTRLLFIYPCVYMLAMLIPFVQHCFNYSDYYAQNPIFAISLMGPICYSLMGTLDCLVFCWREKPWTNIPGSSGTFWGSFCWWRFVGPWVDRRSPVPASREFRIGTQAVQGGGGGTSSSDPEHYSLVLSPPLGSSPTTPIPRPPFNRQDTDHRPGSAGSAKQKFLKTINVVRPAHRRAFSGHSDQASLAAERAAERLALERAAHSQHMSYMSEKTQAGQGGRREWFDQWEEDDEDDEDDFDESDDEEGRGQGQVGSAGDGKERDPSAQEKEKEKKEKVEEEKKKKKEEEEGRDLEKGEVR